MRNIIKALNYQSVRDYYIIIVCLIFVCISAAMPFISMGEYGSMTGGEYFAQSAREDVSLMLIIFTLLISSRICGFDFNDKTVNYEILSGHKRSDVYFGRVIVSLIWCMTGGIIISVMPYVICTVMNGWGQNIDMGGAALHMLLALLPLFRMICEFSFFALIIRSWHVTLIAGYFLSGAAVILQLILESQTEFDPYFLTPYFSIRKIFDLNYRLGFIDGKDVYIFDTAMDASFVLITAGVSIAAGIIILILGCFIFRRRDMN